MDRNVRDKLSTEWKSYSCDRNEVFIDNPKEKSLKTSMKMLQ